MSRGATRAVGRLLRPWSSTVTTAQDFPSLYKLNKREILEFINNVAAKPEQYNVDKSYYGDLQKAATKITTVAGIKGSKFFVDQQTGILNPETLTFEGETLKYYSLYDELGWFMTVLGPAPPEASKENYLIPMGSVFCKWSIALSDGNRLPVMASIVHVPSTPQSLSLINVDIADDPAPDVTLGSSLPFPKPYKDLCQQYRFEMLKQAGRFDLTEEQAPQVPATTHQHFGHCAETYTFTMAMILKNKRHVRLEDMTGVAMEIKKSGVMSELSHSALATISASALRNPCRNCNYLISQMEAVPANFDVGSLEEYADATGTAPATKGAASAVTAPISSSKATAPSAPINPLNEMIGHIASGILQLKPDTKK